MTREEIAIKVATDVWGLTLFDEIKGQAPYWTRTISGPFLGILASNLEKEVFSWSGFGRTVEAMAHKGFFPMLNPSRDDIPGVGKMERMQVEFLYPAYSEHEKLDRGVAGFQLERLVRSVPQFNHMLWGATHLAALEAIK